MPHMRFSCPRSSLSLMRLTWAAAVTHVPNWPHVRFRSLV